MSDFRNVRRLLSEHPWAIMPTYLDVVVEIVGRHLHGERLDQKEIAARLAATRHPRRPGATSGRGIAVVPLAGLLSHRAALVSDVSGPRGMSTERFTQLFLDAHRDREVGAVVLDVNSPGGSIHGVEEAADVVFNARGSKPIVAVANAMAGSAAYWIASQADEVVITPSGEVGSVGVYAMHEDWSRHLDEKLLVDVTYISAGRFKTEAAPEFPLSAEGRSHIQAVVDDYYRTFVAQVARGRKVSTARVERNFGEGRMVMARRAVALGMADRVATLEQTMERLRFPSEPRRSSRAAPPSTPPRVARARAAFEFAKARGAAPAGGSRSPRGSDPGSAA